ncbi:MAG: UDP-3-O-acyl-N-acetylglucosamine deacetylase [Gammaproteobacteria bacterium]|nr:UDP-3-O-acyl-N-acetylglucosamine deacetylase [Gammaproteobacteria bacterium]
MMLQRTIFRTVNAIGIGVHTGKRTRISIRPAAANFGIQFVRDDYPNTFIRASGWHVSDTTLSTSIAYNDVEISTIEHLMSALWGMNIDNAIVHVGGEEVPILDGSAGQFVDLIDTVGTRECSAPRRYLKLKREVKVIQGDAMAALRPFEGFKVAYSYVYNHPVFNRCPKYVELDFSNTSYVEDVSRARSFGLVSELKMAQSVNRCLGSSLENAVGIDESKILNPEGLRYPDEFVKHKTLDAIGDLYLLGMPVLGEFEGYKSGHALNTRLVRAVLRTPEAWTVVNSKGEEVSDYTPIVRPAQAQ